MKAESSWAWSGEWVGLGIQEVYNNGGQRSVWKRVGLANDQHPDDECLGQRGWYYWSSEVSEIKQCFIKNIILKIIRYRLARQLAS